MDKPFYYITDSHRWPSHKLKIEHGLCESDGFSRLIFRINDLSNGHHRDRHLGSVKVTVNAAGEAVFAEDTYAFGGIIRHYDAAGVEQK